MKNLTYSRTIQGRKLVTLFSAPNYCGEFDNSGGLLSVDENLLCSFQILKPIEKIKKPSFFKRAISKYPKDKKLLI